MTQHISGRGKGLLTGKIKSLLRKLSLSLRPNNLHNGVDSNVLITQEQEPDPFASLPV